MAIVESPHEGYSRAESGLLLPSPEVRLTDPYTKVIPTNFPDPSVMQASDGLFYAHATETERGSEWIRIQSAVSSNLLDWEVNPFDALVEYPDWSVGFKTWAPHVIEHDGKFLMYYTTQVKGNRFQRVNGGGAQGISVAISDEPDRGFVDRSKQPLAAGAHYNYWLNCNLDPFVELDEDGQLVLTWGSDYSPIVERPLTDDGLRFQPGTRPKPILSPDANLQYEALIEAPFKYSHGGDKFLFYSGSDCFGNGMERSGIEKFGNYAILVARYDPEKDRYNKRTYIDKDAINNVVMEGNSRIKNPGNNSVITLNGRYFSFTSAIDREDERMGEESQKFPLLNKRGMYITEIFHEDGWPVAPGGKYLQEKRQEQD